jgi:hypothetical protein
LPKRRSRLIFGKNALYKETIFADIIGMNTQLIIPDRINVGFQKRDDTYTKMLGYVIYFDSKGVLRKEKSWQSWRDAKIPNKEFANEPTEGFVLNRDVGGARRSYGWDTRIEKVRVYDPRNFEFEIDIPNLLFILKECDCSRGKGLEGKFVYAWSGTNLVLMPASCEEYKKSKNFTELQTKTIKLKELIPGASYVTKKQETLTFLGKFDYHYLNGPRWKYNASASVDKRLVFWNDAVDADESKKKVGFVFMDTPKPLAALNSDIVHSEYAELVQKYNKSENGSKVVKLFLKAGKSRDENSHNHTWHYEENNSPGVFISATTNYDWQTKKVTYTETSSRWLIKDGKLTQEQYRVRAYAPGMEEKYKRHNSYYYGQQNSLNKVDWVEPTNMQLWAELESGAKFKIDYSTFSKE